MKTVLLSDLLNPEQIQEMEEILKKDDDVRWVELKKYLQTLRVQLESHEVLPEYLFYVIQHQKQMAEFSRLQQN